jgi:hypothetical protein
MPLSSDQDINISSTGASQAKLTHKSSSAGLQIPSKKERKNGQAKDNNTGGVLAAVTKNASKMS